MFQSQLAPNKKLKGKSWLLLLIVGIGSVFFLSQRSLPTDYNDTSSDSLSSETTEQQVEPAAPSGYLAEYDPMANDFLVGTTEDERPLWQEGGALALKLAVVISLVYIVLIGLRWLQKGNSTQASNGTTIRILESINLAPNRVLHLVIVGEKMLLIGATDQQVSLLTELADTKAPLAEDLTAFDEALSIHTSDNQIGEAQQSVAPAVEWQTTVNGLKTGLQRIREAVGDIG